MRSLNRRIAARVLLASVVLPLSFRSVNSEDAKSVSALNSVLSASQEAEDVLIKNLKHDEALPPEQRTSQRYIACVAGALDRYAEKLRELAPSLPPDLQSLPTIVAQTAKRVRSSTTPQEASAAIKDAVLQVKKTIALIRAEDSYAVKTERREVFSVSQTLTFLDTKFEKATGI